MGLLGLGSWSNRVCTAAVGVASTVCGWGYETRDDLTVLDSVTCAVVSDSDGDAALAGGLGMNHGIVTAGQSG